MTRALAYRPQLGLVQDHSKLHLDAHLYVDTSTDTEALSALVEEMRYYADADDDNAFDSLPADAFDDDQPAMLAQVEAIVRDEIKPGHLTGDVGFILEDNQGRNISFWLQWSADDSADEEV
jgi:hypothetical protein